MTLAARISDLITRVGTEFKALRTVTGALGSLTTTDKSSLVNAVNEVKASAGVAIDDAASSSTTTTYSGSKIEAVVLATKTALIGGASAAYDTLVELQTAIQTDDTAIAGLLTADANRLRFDAVQTLSAGQKTQAQTNMDAQSAAAIGNPDVDLVALFNAAIL